jgi:hypothetical protein
MPSVTVSSSDEETGGGSIGQGLLMGNDIRATPGTRRGAASSASDRYMSVMSSLFEECQSHAPTINHAVNGPLLVFNTTRFQKRAIVTITWTERCGRNAGSFTCIYVHRRLPSPHFYSPHLYTILLSKIAP